MPATDTCQGRGHHTLACYGPETHPCPKCGQQPVTQQRLQCGAPATSPLAECVACSLACPDCPAEVRVTEGARLLRARVIHTAECPWLPRYQRHEVAGRIPCGTFVTHRGPYQRDPEAGESA